MFIYLSDCLFVIQLFFVSFRFFSHCKRGGNRLCTLERALNALRDRVVAVAVAVVGLWLMMTELDDDGWRCFVLFYFSNLE